ncbi:MAG: energy-coupling factor transporter ATPase [Roseiflexaceae bacterium]
MLLSLDQVSFRYLGTNRPALRDVSLALPPGQICGVIGRAGAGKSTLCALCAGFIPQFYEGRFSGRALIDGLDVTALPVADLVRHVGLVGSNAFAQISGARFTVFEEIAFGLENLGVPREEMQARVEWAMGLVGIEALRNRSPFELSGGQQQRVVIAATLALRPPLLVLDEPTAQLDPPAIERLAQVLRDLARQGVAILFAEHRLEWTAGLAERVLVLDDGALIADGLPAEVLTSPLLRERGVGWPRPALLAEHLRTQGGWPAERPLPITLDVLRAGLTPQPAPATPAPSPQPPAPNPQPPLVALRDVVYRYPSGVKALRGVSLALGAGERVALLGRNGAGKSTLVRHLNGLLRPASGSVLVAGVESHKASVARHARQVGIVFQDVRNQLFARTVRDELRFGPRNLGYSPARIEALVDSALATLGLAALADEHPYDLQPVLRRLVAIAAVLAMDTPLLVLDEPTAGLDTVSVERLTALCHDLAAQGKSVLVVSHDLDFCYEALERVVLVREGLIALDMPWITLDAPARTTLAQDVGLPIALEVD